MHRDEARINSHPHLPLPGVPLSSPLLTLSLLLALLPHLYSAPKPPPHTRPNPPEKYPSHVPTLQRGALRAAPALLLVPRLPRELRPQVHSKLMHFL